MKDIPTVKAKPTPGGTQWTFYCVHCKRYHFHSVGPGHVVAHCWVDNSPYLKTGYILELDEGVKA